MKYAAFSLVGEPGKTRVGSISPDGMQIEEFDLGVDAGVEYFVWAQSPGNFVDNGGDEYVFVN